MLSSSFSPFSSTLPTGEQLRQPRAIVVINDFYILWTDVTITTTTFYVADSYHIEIPLHGQPQGFDLLFLATQAQLNIKIYIGFPDDPNAFTAEQLDLLMVGDVDEMIVDPLRAIVTFSGRDLTSRFIDTKTYSYYPNQTASNIAMQLAKSHGLGTDKITPTQGQVGIFYTRQNTLMTKETTEWDLLTFLAQQYNYAVYVQANDLVFGPKPNIEDTTPYIISYQPPLSLGASPIANVMTLNFLRSFTVTKDVTVKVRVPFSPQTGKAFTVTAGKKNPTINSTSAGNQIYTFSYAGLTKQQALAKAQSLVREITLNEMKISCTLPGDNLLTKASLIRVIGSNSRFDQYYYTDTVVRTINLDGYMMEINAKNMDVNSQVTL